MASIAEIIGAEVSATSPGMAVGVSHRGEVIHRQGYGLANLEWQTPITPTTVFRLASITKQFTAAAIMILVEQGKLSLEDSLTKFLPDYPTNGHEISIYHLLTHTSGIKSYTDIEGFMGIQDRHELTPAELSDIFSQHPFDFSPGEKWHYNNSGYALLGMILEKITGMGYGEFIEREIFAPLGMEQSYYLDNAPIIPQRASGYMKTKDGFRNADYISMRIPYAGGALGSTIDDMLIWQKALQENRLLSAKTLAQMQMPVRLNDGSTYAYGFGWMLNDYRERRVVHHGGDIQGFDTKQLYVPDEDLAVIVLANCSGFDTEQIAIEIMEHVLELPTLEHTLQPLDTDTQNAVLGTYLDESFGIPFEVIAQEGKLIVKPMGVELIRHGETSFHDANDPKTVAEFSEIVDGKFQRLRWLRPLITLNAARKS